VQVHAEAQKPVSSGQLREVTIRGGRTRRDAVAKLERIQREIHEEEVLGRRPITEISIEEWIEYYLVVIQETHSPNTVRRYGHLIRKRFTALGGMLVNEIHREDVMRLFVRRVKVKNVTRNHELAVLSGLFKAAVALGFARENPCRGIKRWKIEERAVPYLSPEQQHKLVEVAPSTIRNAIILALDTGLRQGELVRLEWRDANLDGNTITVRLSKSKKPRIVHLFTRTVAILRTLRETRTIPLDGADLVLPELRGCWCGSFDRLWKRTLQTAGLPDLRWHDLRHLYAVNLVRAGVPLPDVAASLGQNTLSVTCRYGGHLPENHGSRARDLAETRLFGESPLDGKTKKPLTG
jgi:integrase